MQQPSNFNIQADIETVAMTLAGSSVVLSQFVFEGGEPCTHTPAEARQIVAHLLRLDPAASQDLAIRLARLGAIGIHTWSGNPACPLCTFLRNLAATAK